MTYEYYINLEERGEFYADIRNSLGDTVYDLFQDEETGVIQPVYDGFMKHTKDLVGLRKYLIYRGIIKIEDEVIKGN